MHASFGDEEPRPEEAADLRSFFEYDSDDSTDGSLDDDDIPPNEDPLEQEAQEVADELYNQAEQDRLAYERLIIEGADVENAGEEMEDLDATISKVQESYLDGSAYNAAPEVDRNPIKREEDFPYPSMPEFELGLIELLEEAKMHGQARHVQDSKMTIGLNDYLMLWKRPCHEILACLFVDGKVKLVVVSFGMHVLSGLSRCFFVFWLL